MAAKDRYSEVKASGMKVPWHESSSFELSTLLPQPSGHIDSISENAGRPRSSTTSVFLDYIDNETHAHTPMKKSRQKLMSLYRLLVLELNLPGQGSAKMTSVENCGDMSKAQEQLTNMVKVPFYLEKFICFGLLLCSNAFLTLFTLVPLKITIVCYSAFRDYLMSPQRNFDVLVRKIHFVKRDLITLLLIIFSVAVLSTPLLDVSRLYHDIRGQAHIKLYVMFGVLEVTDKLLSSTVQEVFTVLAGLPLTHITPKKLVKLVFVSLAALAFFACHSYTLIYQAVALHVAANSYSNALLALLLSNQFSELKGAVFKKFEREGLFQITMSDLTERFQLSIMLFVIALRNLSQLSSTQLGLIPDSWKSWNKWFGAIFGPTVVVLGSEIFVDWIKHCYISKFNLIRPRIYENFLFVLSSDFKDIFTSNSKINTLHEVSDYILLTKRIGLPIISLTICFLRMALRDLKKFFMPSSLQLMSILASVVLIILAFVVLLVIRLLLSLWLLKWAQQIKRSHEEYQDMLRSTTALSSPNSHSSGAGLDEDRENERYVSASLFPVLNLEKEGDGHYESGLQSHCPPYLMDESTIDPVGEEESPCDTSFAFQTDSEIEYSFLPGVPNTESSSINPKSRLHLYDHGETVPPTLEEKRNALFVKKRSKTPEKGDNAGIDTLHTVHRYEMSSKKIW